MISSWIRHYDQTHIGSVAASLPFNLLLAADGVSPEAPADWIQLPDGNGSTVTFVNGAGESVILTASSTIQTWACRVTKITACSGNVIAGTGEPPLLSVASVTGATGATGAAGTNGSAWASVTGGGGSPITANHTLAIDELCIADTTSAGFTATLPTAVGNAGHRCGIKDGKASGSFATHNLTVATISSQTVDGGAPAALATNKQCAVYVSDGANWILDHS